MPPSCVARRLPFNTMKIIIIGLSLFLFLICIFSVFIRTLVFHPIKTIFYTFKDIINYYRYHKYDYMQTGKLICYTALFGGGKTLSCVHYVNSLYDRYNNRRIFDIDRKKWVTQKVHIISNVDINRPYEHLDSLAQIVRVAEKFRQIDLENDTLTCTVVLGDEFSVQMNSRSFKTNIDPLFLNTLLTCRHHHIMLIYNAQRFNHVDALLRQVTSYVVECKKIWRVVIQTTYDAYTLENTSDPQAVRSLGQNGWFVQDSDFKAFDTLATVNNLKKSVESFDMDSEIEIINRQGQNERYDVGSFKRLRKLKR